MIKPLTLNTTDKKQKKKTKNINHSDRVGGKKIVILYDKEFSPVYVLQSCES